MRVLEFTRNVFLRAQAYNRILRNLAREKELYFEGMLNVFKFAFLTIFDWNV